jgi:IclR family acetate operon transcriptional repressor
MRLPEAWFVARTVRALEVLAFQPQSAPQVAAALQVHPRTARRLLNRLMEEGYLTRSDDARRLYSPTLRIVALAGQIVERSELSRVAAPFVARLHERTGAPAHLMVPSYRSALCLVHSANGCGEPRPQLRELVPVHCTAGGKALLGERAPWRESVLGAPLERHTDATITDPDALRAELDAGSLRGYATERGEYQAGVWAVAAPVFSPAGEAVAALSAAAPESAALEELADEVVGIAHELTIRLREGDG